MILKLVKSIRHKLKEQFNVVDSKFPALCYLPFVSRKDRNDRKEKIRLYFIYITYLKSN